MSLKLLVIGYGRHGKDEFAGMINEICGLRPYSSSKLAAELFIFDHLRAKYGYQTIEECLEDRSNHRAEWHDLITEYNTPDKARLAKELLKRADIYVGMRNDEEIEACKEQELFDAVVWVDADKRKPKEDWSSCKISKADADIIIDNNGTLEELRESAKTLVDHLMGEGDQLVHSYRKAVDDAIVNASVFIANSIPAYGSGKILIVPSGDGEYEVSVGGRVAGEICEIDGYVSAVVKLCP